jgi:hypothetical protein
MTKTVKHEGDLVELSVRYPELRVFKCSEKQGIKKIKQLLIDDTILERNSPQVSISSSALFLTDTC